MDRRHQQRFEALLREHQMIVIKVAALYARSAEDRHDLAQEICAQLWRAFPAYDEQRRFSTWMYRIALKVAISQARREQGAAGDRVESLGARHLETIADGERIAEQVVEQDERLTALHAFIARLDPLNRALILLYLDDRNHAEIADVLGNGRAWRLAWPAWA